MALNWQKGVLFVGGVALGASAAVLGVMGWDDEHDAEGAQPARSMGAPAAAASAPSATALADECDLKPILPRKADDDGRVALQARPAAGSEGEVATLILDGKEAAAANRQRDAEILFLNACRNAARVQGDPLPLANAMYQLGRHYANVAAFGGQPAKELFGRAERLYSASYLAYQAKLGPEHEKTRFAEEGLKTVQQVTGRSGPVVPSAQAPASAAQAAAAPQPAPAASAPVVQAPPAPAASASGKATTTELGNAAALKDAADAGASAAAAAKARAEAEAAKEPPKPPEPKQAKAKDEVKQSSSAARDTPKAASQQASAEADSEPARQAARKEAQEARQEPRQSREAPQQSRQEVRPQARRQERDEERQTIGGATGESASPSAPRPSAAASSERTAPVARIERPRSEPAPVTEPADVAPPEPQRSAAAPIIEPPPRIESRRIVPRPEPAEIYAPPEPPPPPPPRLRELEPPSVGVQSLPGTASGSTGEPQ